MKHIVGSGDYTPAEDINDVRQLVALVKARPAIKVTGERGTLIAYSELAMIERRLAHALAAIADLNDAANDAIKVMRQARAALDFPRPMGAPKVDGDK